VSRVCATREIDASLNPGKGERAFLFMAKILPPARPKKPENDVRAIVKHFNLDPRRLAIVFIRGYFLDSMGAPGVNDANVYDDAAFLVGPSLFESYNANTDPSFVKVNGRELAKLNLGRYLFYKGKHKNKYPALRSYPEGIMLDCTRNGKPGTAQYINIHKGSTNPNAKDVVWSEGCLTIPDIQWPDFQARVYSEMSRMKQKVIEVMLIENRKTAEGQKLFDHMGKVIN
jgi:lysozyme